MRSSDKGRSANDSLASEKERNNGSSRAETSPNSEMLGVYGRETIDFNCCHLVDEPTVGDEIACTAKHR